ncbi:MAG: pilus assembly protein PilM [Myxococcota bacterium]|nr:pilus assembly protein PilM [Myxococcota bacterium]
MPTILGIDLGAHTIKLSLMEGGFGRYQFSDVRLRRVPQDIDAPPTLEGRLSALTDLMSEVKDVTITSTTWPAQSTSIRRITLPFGDRAQVEKTLPFEVEEHVPFDLDETILASRILSNEPSESVVLAAMAPSEAVSDYLTQLKAAGIDPKHLSLDSDLIGTHADDGVQAVIDFGHTRTLVALTQDGKVITSRAITGGGRDLTLALAEARGIDWNTAEGLKHAASISTRSQDTTAAEASWDEDEKTQPEFISISALSDTDNAAILLSALRPLLNNIRASLINFEDVTSLEVDEVLICGGGAALDGLREHLTEDLGVPVRRVILEDINDVEPARFALALALGQQATGMTYGREIDMRQGDLAFQGDLATIGNFLRIGVLAAVAMMMVGTGWFAFRYAQLSTELSSTDAEIQTLALSTFPGEITEDDVMDASDALAVMQLKSTEAAVRVDALGSILSDVPPTLSMLRQLSDAMPPHSDTRIDVREMSISSTSITMKAEADGYEDAAKVETSLQSVEAFKNAKKGEEKRYQESIRFSVTIPLETPDTEEG